MHQSKQKLTKLILEPSSLVLKMNCQHKVDYHLHAQHSQIAHLLGLLFVIVVWGFHFKMAYLFVCCMLSFFEILTFYKNSFYSRQNC